MHIARYRTQDDVHYGILEDDRLHRLEGQPFEAQKRTGQVDRLDDVRLLTPVEAPRVFGVGLNYVKCIEGLGAKTPPAPVLFWKPGTSVIGTDEAIVYPREGTEVHFESELTVVIGRGGRRISEQAALDHVLGYTIANDVADRVIQKAEAAFASTLIGKGFDTFCPVGPWITTGLDPSNLKLGAKVNGEVRQDDNTSDMLFSVPQLIAWISAAITLLPGDLIITGTPLGFGPIKPGDVVECTIEGIGTLRNPVVAEA